MNSHLNYLIRAAAVAAAIEISAGVAGAQILDFLTPPAVPAELQVPEGNAPFLKVNATGSQNYLCLLSTSGTTAGKYTWKFIGPQATLFMPVKWIGGDIPVQVGTHFLSYNPAEDLGRPTWQSSLDTSAVWGKQLASSTDSRFVEAGAIPWLLLQVVRSKRGPSGGDILAQATYIHRIKTSGGAAPAAVCSETENNGVTMFVPYTADYVFYRGSRR